MFSILVIGVTTIISGLQIVYPELLAALRRDPGAIHTGELWRLATALFVQPNGWGQCVANGFLILAFIMPAAERLYGRNILGIYLTSGIIGQTVNYLRDSGSGGSSTAIFGIMGSLLVYIVRHRKVLLCPFVFIAGAGLLSSAVMVMSHDAHGIGIIVGALVALILPLSCTMFRDTETGTFVESSAGLHRSSQRNNPEDTDRTIR